MARACFRAVSAGGVTLRPLLTVPAAAGRLPASAKASLDAQMQANPAAEHWVLEVPEK